MDSPGIVNIAYHYDNNEFDASTKNKTESKDLEKAEDEIERVKWGNGLEFLMSCIAMSVGLGNIWRFPFTAYENGGGAFLIPYIIVLFIVGKPLYYMEMSLGQFCSQGNLKMFEQLVPALKGIGYGQLITAIYVGTYYCSLMAVTLFYLVSSFTSNLPWSECKEEWATDLALNNLTCVSSLSKFTGKSNSTNSVTSSELWFTKEVLQESAGIDDGIGLPEWRLTLCLFVAWLIIFLVSVRSIKSSGKVSYFLATFPYVILFALLVRALTLEGCLKGIWYFLKPNWSKLLSAKVWYAAVTQCFYSLNVGFGTIIMYSSYNNFDRDINRDVTIVTGLDTFTSLLAGTTIFGILGNLAFELDVDVKDVINTGGTALAFISYPEAISKFDTIPWFFAILFFMMLFVLGVGSIISLTNLAITAIIDANPSLKSWQISGMIAIGGFLIGLVYTTPGGQFVLNLVDFSSTFLVFALAVIEVTVVLYWYGLQNICIDLEFMLGKKVSIYWRIMWGIVTPLTLYIIFIYFASTIKRLEYGKYGYPDAAIYCGWILVFIGIIQVVLWIFHTLYTNKEFGTEKMFLKSFGDEKWGPMNLQKFKEYKQFKERKLEEISMRGKTRLQRIVDTLIGRT